MTDKLAKAANRRKPPAGLIEWLAKTSDSSLDAAVLKRMTEAADARRHAIEAIEAMVDSAVQSRLVEWFARARRSTRWQQRNEVAIVADMLAREGLFEPWFQRRQMSVAIRQRQTNPQLHKWTEFMTRYGCLICHDRTREHAGQGMCQKCRNLVVGRLESIIGELEAQSSTYEVWALPPLSPRRNRPKPSRAPHLVLPRRKRKQESQRG
jgi:hypothetical protein